jgi:nitroreductase
VPFDKAPAGRNAATQVILSRRSVREQYEQRPVPVELVEEILRCGLAAPSSKNARPWRLHVVTDRHVLGDLADTVAMADGADSYVPKDPLTGVARPDWPSSVAESAAVLRSVPLGIFVENVGAFSRGRGVLASISQENLRGCLVGYTMEIIGIGAAIMNMLLAASSLGVQALFMGDVCVAERAIAAKLGFSCDLIGVLAIGYSQAPVSPNRVHYDVSDETRVVWHGH